MTTMLPDTMYRYVILSLEGLPTVVEALLAAFGEEPELNGRWDLRPDPDRFTIREVLAHLADWDEIFLQRLQRFLAEDVPTLPDIDEGQIAIERDYASQSVKDSLARLKANRAQLVAFARELSPDQRARMANRELVGTLSVEVQLAYITAHDGYHTRQLAEYRAL